ncbi:hypothetical protein G6F42_019976 [Rhizopus arrhizus]|nr:hypothetical protein G6F42_019976 [Rhizopus arrhizus]
MKIACSYVITTDWDSFKIVAAVGKGSGFKDGKEYNLNNFQAVCNEFKTDHFKKTRPEGSSTVAEDECEREFWRLVGDPNEACHAEYGADLHGSAFSTADPMSGPWNLNAISVAPQSLFTDIKFDISSLMMPRLYIGSCFSAFGWHNEDHYTGSISYMHWGETKTWYSVSGYDSAGFQDAMRKTVPELFKQQPDLISQRATMLSPERLKKKDVPVYAIDQRPGEFVVTYPQAYHSGFNHGFNMSETVNFANRPPVFTLRPKVKAEPKQPSSREIAMNLLKKKNQIFRAPSSSVKPSAIKLLKSIRRYYQPIFLSSSSSSRSALARASASAPPFTFSSIHYFLTLCNIASTSHSPTTSLSKKRKHNQDDSDNDNIKPSKKSK